MEESSRKDFSNKQQGFMEHCEALEIETAERNRKLDENIQEILGALAFIVYHYVRRIPEQEARDLSKTVTEYKKQGGENFIRYGHLMLFSKKTEEHEKILRAQEKENPAGASGKARRVLFPDSVVPQRSGLLPWLTR